MSHPVNEAAHAGADATPPSGLKNPGYEIFIALLSILSIVNLVLIYVVTDPALDTVLAIMNVPLTLIFLIDFLYRLKTAPAKGYYFFRNWGWADLLASLPFHRLRIRASMNGQAKMVNTTKPMLSTAAPPESSLSHRNAT